MFQILYPEYLGAPSGYLWAAVDGPGLLLWNGECNCVFLGE